VIWAVFNGYLGNGWACAIVEADGEQSAFEQAIDAFAADDKRPAYSTPNAGWHAEQITPPYVCELS
jgi:hypothetical protein